MDRNSNLKTHRIGTWRCQEQLQKQNKNIEIEADMKQNLFFYLQFYHHHLYHSHTEEYFCSQLLSPVVLAVDPAQIVAATVEDAGVVSDVVQTLAACWAATASGCV